MFTEELEQYIAAYFDIPWLDAGPFEALSSEGHEPQYIHPVFIWAVQLPHHTRVRDDDERVADLYVAVVQTKEWKRGLLLVSSIEREPIDFQLLIQHQPIVFPPTPKRWLGDALQPVELQHEDDTIWKLFQHVDLTYNRMEAIFGNFALRRYDLIVRTRLLSTRMSLDGGLDNEHPPTEQLWRALWRFVNVLVERHNDAEINEFFRLYPLPYRT